MKSLLERKVRLALGSAILALLVVGAISYRSTVVFIEKKFSRTSKVLLFAMERIGSSYRGFVLTVTKSYLEPYRGSR